VRDGENGHDCANRIYATCDIGQAALDRLREKGFAVEVYPDPQPPPKALVLEKVRSGIQALITTLRDKIDEEVFAAGRRRGSRWSRRSPSASTTSTARRPTATRSLHAHARRADGRDGGVRLLHDRRRARAASTRPRLQVRERQWTTWHPYLPWLGDEVTGRTLAVIGTGRIGKSMVAKAMGFDMDVLCHSSRGASSSPTTWPPCSA
jgi:glyoxylate reductase